MLRLISPVSRLSETFQLETGFALDFISSNIGMKVHHDLSFSFYIKPPSFPPSILHPHHTPSTPSYPFYP